MIAVVGPLSWDIVENAPRRPGGTVYHAARALARVGAEARLGASCAAVDRAELIAALEAFGFPVTWHESPSTTAYRFRYTHGGRRIMRQDAVGAPWDREAALAAVGDARWVHVGGLVRTDFPSTTLTALAPGRTLLVDAQGLVRTPALGPLRRDNRIGDVLSYVTILKLDAEEAETLVGGPIPELLRALAVPEVILTLGPKGAVVVTQDRFETIPAREVAGPVDPTGAGDMFSTVYLATRSAEAEPVEAARAAAETVAELLSST